MIGLDSPAFWAIVLLLGVATRFLDPRGRMVAFLIATGCLYYAAPRELVLLAGVAAYGFVALRIGTSDLAMAAHIAVLASLLALSQHTRALLPATSGWAGVLPLIGLPYVFLRAVHVLVECRRGALQPPTLLQYATYILPFHQIIAGPIERFPAFLQKLTAPVPSLTTSAMLTALGRITDGFVKKAVLASLLKRTAGFEFESSGLALLVEIDLYALYMYFDFSGYMDIVIGAGMLAGWQPPENFNSPYLSRNLIEFWTRWHITLGDWIRDYVFLPLSLMLQRSTLASRPVLCAFSAYAVSMFVCGLWHRFDTQFAIWGLLHGCGIGMCKIWEALIKRRVGSKGLKRYRENRWVGAVAGAINFQYIAASFLFAFHAPADALRILGRLL